MAFLLPGLRLTARTPTSASIRTLPDTAHNSTRRKTGDEESFWDLMGYHRTTWDAIAPALTGGRAATLIVD